MKLASDLSYSISNKLTVSDWAIISQQTVHIVVALSIVLYYSCYTDISAYCHSNHTCTCIFNVIFPKNPGPETGLVRKFGPRRLEGRTQPKDWVLYWMTMRVQWYLLRSSVFLVHFDLIRVDDQLILLDSLEVMGFFLVGVQLWGPNSWHCHWAVETEQKAFWASFVCWSLTGWRSWKQEGAAEHSWAAVLNLRWSSMFPRSRISTWEACFKEPAATALLNFHRLNGVYRRP